MTSALPVRFTRLAADQVRLAERWWHANRQAAPNAVREEVDIALALISAQPRIGPRARNVSLPNIRRIFLPRIGYDLYYRLWNDVIEVLALWHTRRGDAPPI